VADVQEFIESSKFEAGADGADAQAIERLTADTQTVFVVLLAIARDAASAARPADAVQAATTRIDDEVATILDGLADGVRDGGVARVIDVDGSLAALQRSIAVQVAATREDPKYAGAIALYRELAGAVNRIVSDTTRSIATIELSEVAG